MPDLQTKCNRQQNNINFVHSFKSIAEQQDDQSRLPNCFRKMLLSYLLPQFRSNIKDETTCCLLKNKNKTKQKLSQKGVGSFPQAEMWLVVD